MFDCLLPGQMDYKAGYSKGYAAGFKVYYDITLSYGLGLQGSFR
jgi:hypothetical protein